MMTCLNRSIGFLALLSLVGPFSSSRSFLAMSRATRNFQVALTTTLICLLGNVPLAAGTTINGDRVKWHPITISFAGPLANETDDSPNPFLDYRLQVTFTGPSGQNYLVPGFFDGDGNGGGGGGFEAGDLTRFTNS